AAEVRDVAIDLRDLRGPPGLYPRIEGVGGFEPAQGHGRAEGNGEIHPDAIGTQHARERRGFLQVQGRQDVRRRVDVVENGPVDSDGRAGARIVAVAGREILRQGLPFPDGVARVTALHRAVQVVPVIEHATLDAGARCDV